MKAVAIASLALSGCFLTNTGDQYRFGDAGMVVMPDSSAPPEDVPMVDIDMDGYLTPADCDDNDMTVNPGATEVCNGKDDDCRDGIDVGATDGTEYFADADGDAYGTDSVRLCAVTAGFAMLPGDCDEE